MNPLTRAEAAERSRLLTVRRYDIELDLTRGDEEFRSLTRIRFDCTEPGASTFLDLAAKRVETATLNGTQVDPSAIGEDRITLTDLREQNELEVIADFEYSRTGEGLHRFVDPADGEAYTWAETGLFNAARVFGAFDQPDLKAPLRLRVKAPHHWTVISNAPGRQTSPGEWEFDETPPLATYLMVVVAGPYHSIYADTDRPIPLGLHARQSIAEHVDADELFEHTRASFDFFHRIFGVPYAFGKYDQAFVPEFNMGAMENPGCVKFSDKFVYRSRVTDTQRATRTMILAHEMAHMWFGDLVTLRWWDDLWLNESFAEYMGFLALAEATRFTSAWTAFCVTVKAWGYRQDELPSTHPIAADVPDTDAALLNLDGISYAKGAGVLKQLVAFVGFDAFVAGLRTYMERHAHGNTTLRDLLDALEESSGRDLKAWSAEWLESAGVNVLRPESVEDDGVYRSFAVLQSAAHDHPTLRSHRIAIGLYDRSDERMVRRNRIEVEVAGDRTDVPDLAGIRVPDLLLLNDDDLTWAKIRLDERSLETIREGWLSRIDDSLPRALLWASAWDTTRDGELPVGDYLGLVTGSIGAEEEIALVEDILARTRQAIDLLGRPDARDERLAAFAARGLELLGSADEGSDLQLAYARSYARSVASRDDVARIRGWLDGRDIPAGLAIDEELRWLIIRRLAVIGAVDADEIEAEHERDRTLTGHESALAARAALPTEAAKAEAWEAIISSTELSGETLRLIGQDFWHPEQVGMLEPYVERYFEALPGIWETRSSEMAARITGGLFPALFVSPQDVERVDRMLAAGLDPALRRLLIEGRADLERAARTRAADRSPTSRV